MTEKIYEYRDEKNWFIGTWAGFNYFTCFFNFVLFLRRQKSRELSFLLAEGI